MEYHVTIKMNELQDTIDESLMLMKKQDIKEHTQSDSIYLKFRSRRIILYKDAYKDGTIRNEDREEK